MTIYSSSARTLACTVAAATCLVGLGASSAVVAPAAVAFESAPFASVKGQTITVVMEGGSTSTPDIQKLLPQFERATGIHVNYDVIPYDSLTSRVLLDFSSQQSSPDVVFDDWAYGRQFATDHYIVPLNSFERTAQQFVQPKDFVQSYLSTMQLNGAQYGLPVYGETTLLIYNKADFKKYGIARPPATMQELARDAQLISTRSGGKVAGYSSRGAPGIQSVYIYAGFLRAFGGHWYRNGRPDVNSPAAVKAATFYANLLRQSGPPGVANFEFSQNQEALCAGQVAMSIDADGLAALCEDPSQSQVVGQLGFAPVPYAAGQKPVGANTNHSLEVHGLYLSRYSKHKLAAWDFMQWATNPKVQIAELRDQPQPGVTANAAVDSAIFVKQYGSFRSEMLNQLVTGNPRYLPAGIDSNAMITDVGQAVNSVIAGGGSASQALNTAQKQITGP